MSRIKADDANAYPAGTVITNTSEIVTTSLGQVTIGPRSTYQVRETHYPQSGGTDITLIGPRGSVYLLMAYGKDGIFQAVSLNTGAPLHRHGNEVLFIRLGNIIEPTSRDKIAASAKARRDAERATR